MEEKNTELLAQYDLSIYRTSRMKGACLLETDRGVKLFGSCSLSAGRAEFEQKIKQYLAEQGFAATDRYVRTREGEILVYGPYHEPFAMRDWFDGEECNARRPEQLLQACGTLARLHNCLAQVELKESERPFCTQPKLNEVLERRNRELRRVRSYISEKKQHGSFENLFLAHFYRVYDQAVQAKEALDEAVYLPYYERCVCEGRMFHGNYTHHSVWVQKNGESAVVSFEKAGTGVQIHDFYLLFRKMMEKHDWDTGLGYAMLNAYERVRSIPKQERLLLPVLLKYPEKFWKITNQYYNNRKSWIPQKNMQKLTLTMEQDEQKQTCIRELFGAR